MEDNNNETVKTVSYSKTTINIPEEYRPIGPWGYIGYQLLFALPLIGFIFLLVFAFGEGNVNVKNFARSYLIVMLIGVVFAVIILLIALLLGVSFNAFARY